MIDYKKRSWLHKLLDETIDDFILVKGKQPFVVIKAYDYKLSHEGFLKSNKSELINKSLNNQQWTTINNSKKKGQYKQGKRIERHTCKTTKTTSKELHDPIIGIVNKNVIKVENTYSVLKETEEIFNYELEDDPELEFSIQNHYNDSAEFSIDIIKQQQPSVFLTTRVIKFPSNNGIILNYSKDKPENQEAILQVIESAKAINVPLVDPTSSFILKPYITNSVECQTDPIIIKDKQEISTRNSSTQHVWMERDLESTTYGLGHRLMKIPNVEEDISNNTICVLNSEIYTLEKLLHEYEEILKTKFKTFEFDPLYGRHRKLKRMVFEVD
jgi:hypothetical protein